MRKLVKFTIITLAIVIIWNYFEDIKEEMEADKLIKGMTTSYEGLYRISYIGDFTKKDQEFNRV